MHDSSCGAGTPAMFPCGVAHSSALWLGLRSWALGYALHRHLSESTSSSKFSTYHSISLRSRAVICHLTAVLRPMQSVLTCTCGYDYADGPDRRGYGPRCYQQGLSNGALSKLTNPDPFASALYLCGASGENSHPTRGIAKPREGLNS